MPFFNPSPNFELLEDEPLTKSLSRYIKFREKFDYRASFIYSLASAVGGSPTLEFRKSIKNAIYLSEKDFEQIPIDLLLTNKNNEQLNDLKSQLDENSTISEEDVQKEMGIARKKIHNQYKELEKEDLCYHLLSNYIEGLKRNFKHSDSLEKEIKSVQKILDRSYKRLDLSDTETNIEQIFRN